MPYIISDMGKNRRSANMKMPEKKSKRNIVFNCLFLLSLFIVKYILFKD